METIADRLKRLRTQQGMTPFELSIAATIPEQNIRLWEKGRKISDPESIAALAEALDTTTDFLIRGIHPQPLKQAG